MSKLLLSQILIFISLVSNLSWAAEDYFSFGTESSPLVETLPSFSEAPSYALAYARDWSLQIDRYFSPEVGSDLIISVLRGYQFLDDKLTPGNLTDNNSYIRLGRVAKFLLLEGSLVGIGEVAQHEMFGHGFRAREFHLKNLHYHITPWSGSTSFKAEEFQSLSCHEKAAVNTGGIEANSILAKELRNRWLHSRKLDSREAHFYVATSLDQTFYVLDTKFYKDKTFLDGHDINEYINNLNQWHQRTVLTAHQLRRKILLDFLDPYLFYSLYSIGLYLIDGNQSFEYPMIPLGEYEYLPSIRMILAPYGPEYQLNNLIRKNENIIQVGLRYGNTGDRHSFGLTMEATDLLTSDLLFIGGKIDLWHQPKMFSLNSGSGGRYGAALSLVARYFITSKIAVKGQAGYKTTGYIPGEALKHSPIFRIGLTAFF